MSSAAKPSKNRDKRSKKRHSDPNRSSQGQGPHSVAVSDDSSMVVANGKGHHKVPDGDVNETSPEHDGLRSKLARKIAELIHNQGPEERSVDLISLLVEESNKEYEQEVEMLREEVQNLKRMLHDATGMLQQIPKEQQNAPAAGEKIPNGWFHEDREAHDEKHARELRRLKKRLHEENKQEMDKLRQYFERQCSQSQTDYVKEIYALKMECQELEQMRGEAAMLKKVCDERKENVNRLEKENADIMREKAALYQNSRHLDTTLMKMEKDKLAAEERTKKILLAVREGLHKLSDMRSEEGPPTGQAGLSTFYNHVEEIITTDDWGDDDVYTKGVMEEIQVSVQKLNKTARTPERPVVFEPRERVEQHSMDSQTDFPPSTPSAEVDAIKSSFETRIMVLGESLVSEKRQYEHSSRDLREQLTKMTKKNEADRKFIEELSAERDVDREEVLKVTRNLEGSWGECDRLTERISSLQQSVEDVENQLKVTAAQNDTLETVRRRLHDDVQAKEEVLAQRNEVISILERQLNDKVTQETNHQRQLEYLKLELSSFLRSPPRSPEPNVDSSFTFDELRKQILDLRDELEARNRTNETEREERISSLEEEVEKARKNEQRAVRDRESLDQQIGSLEIDNAMLRQQLDDARFNVPDEDLIEEFREKAEVLQKDLETAQLTIEKQALNVTRLRNELEAIQRNYEEAKEKLEEMSNLPSREDLMKRMEHFETKNRYLVEQMEETAQLWDDQQREWEEDIQKKSSEIAALKSELAESRDLAGDLEEVRQEMDDLRKQLEEAERTAREKAAFSESLKNLIDIMKTEAVQKDAAVRALQRQFNDNSGNLARQLEEMQKGNSSMRDEIDAMRNAPNRSSDHFESLVREKDAEISHLRVLVEASLDDPFESSSVSPRHVEQEIQTEHEENTADRMEQEIQTEIEQRVPSSDFSIQVDLSETLQDLQMEITLLKATVREMEHSSSLKENQMEAMAVELASLNDRHGKTQTKHRTTIRYLNRSQNSSGDDEVSQSVPESGLNGESRGLIAKYESRISELEKTHADEMERLVQESLSVLHNQSMLVANSSLREISPGNFSVNSNDDSTLNEAALSDNLQRALRELKNGSEAILKASQNFSNGYQENWPPERELLTAKITFFRETINQLVLSRDSMEMALRHIEQQNDELKSELEMIKKEDQMADQGKDLLLSLLKKTEAELAELHARYRQRDLRLEIEQAGREREEREREKLQKELRDTEVQLVRIRGELRQKEAQWERERILTMWKKDAAAEVEGAKSSWKAKYLRAESYRKNLTHQKQYLVTLVDDIILHTTDQFAKQLALNGIRPNMYTRNANGPFQDRRNRRFRRAVLVVMAVLKWKMICSKWRGIRNSA